MNTKELFQNVNHQCLKEVATIEVENAFLSGKQSIEPDLILEAVCSKCGLVVAKNYTDNHWVSF